jgi:hypothetical protein
MDERVERFLEERRRRRDAGGLKLRYSEEAKALAVSYAESKRAEGMSVYQAARDLGLGVQTLAAWMAGKPARASRAFRRVEVVPAASPSSGALTLRTVSGHTIGGLDVSALVRLVRELDGR